MFKLSRLNLCRAGDANNTHIIFEICEDNVTDKIYFAPARGTSALPAKGDLVDDLSLYKEAVELAAYLSKQYKITDKNIIGHYEGYQKKIG